MAMLSHTKKTPATAEREAEKLGKYLGASNKIPLVRGSTNACVELGDLP
jgi:hypothetical protein